MEAPTPNCYTGYQAAMLQWLSNPQRGYAMMPQETLKTAMTRFMAPSTAFVSQTPLLRTICFPVMNVQPHQLSLQNYPVMQQASPKTELKPKPNQSYIGLIATAILDSREKKLVLSDIYNWIIEKHPYFNACGPGWKNSIRHNLSLNDCFVKLARTANGKGHYWTIHPANMEDFMKGDFRRRKAQQRVKNHQEQHGKVAGEGISEREYHEQSSPASSIGSISSSNKEIEPMQTVVRCKRAFDIESLLADDPRKRTKVDQTLTNSISISNRSQSVYL